MVYLDYLLLRIYGYSENVDIGICYQYGKHVSQNIETAKRYYLLGANEDDHKAYSRLCDLYKLEGNPAESFYYKGKTLVHLNYWQNAIDAFKEAAALNHAKSMKELGLLLLADHDDHGTRIKANVDAALDWLRQAAKAGNNDALQKLQHFPAGPNKAKADMILAQMYEAEEINNEDPIREAYTLYLKCSNAGNHDATHRMGHIRELGLGNFILDIEGSFELYLKGAKAQHQPCINALERLASVNRNAEQIIAVANLYFTNLKVPVTAATWLKQALDWGNNELNKKIDDFLKVNPDLAYQVALLYEVAKKRSHSQYPYYAMAAKQTHAAAFAKLNNDADNKSVDAIFHLGLMYRSQHKWDQAIQTFTKGAELGDTASIHQLTFIYSADRKIHGSSQVLKKDITLRVYWLRKAAPKNSTALKVLVDLSKTEPTASTALASMYEGGEIDGLKDFSQVLDNLKLASTQNDIDASFRLGEIYQNGLHGEAISLQESFNYYSVSAKQKHAESLAAIEEVVAKLNDDNSTLQLGIIYQAFADKESEAIATFIKLVLKGVDDAMQHLKKLVQNGPETAFEIAKQFKSYYNDVADEHAYYFYALAAKENQAAALTTLQDAANENIAYAQSNLGALYWLSKNETLKAIDWCILAAVQQNKLAIKFLNTYGFSANQDAYIASKYEQGETKDVTLAIAYYEKAIARNNKDAAFNLGQFLLAEYNSNLASQTITLTRIFNCFVTAYKLGRKDALIILEGMGPELDANSKAILGKLYSPNSKKGEKWLKLAISEGSLDAARQLLDNTPSAAASNNSFFANAPRPSPSAPTGTRTQNNSSSRRAA